MRCLQLIVFPALVAHSYADEEQYFMDNSADMLADRALKASPFHHGAAFDDTTLGKSSHLLMSRASSAALPVSPSALRSTASTAHSCLVPPASFFEQATVSNSPTPWTGHRTQYRLKSTATDEETKIGAVGSKLTDKELAIEALGFWVDSPEVIQDIVSKMEPSKGGVNNIVQYVTTPEGKKLLRIYNNGLDTPRVKFEHAILEKLNSEHKFPYSIPNFQKSSKTGTSFVKLSNGAEACLCDFIDGDLPKLTCVEAIGEASGEMNTAMGKLEGVDLTGSSDPHDDMWNNHHALTREGFIEEMKGPAFDGNLRKVADEMMEETLEVTRKCQEDYKSLPRQLIHADMHYDNILAKDGKVTGILDFEFAAFEWRAMDLAICLSKYAGEPKALEYFDEFVQGYSKTAVMTRPEALAMPDLINLRVLSNVAYFVGRSIAKEDDISALTTRIENYDNRIQWIKQNAVTIQNIIIKHFGLGDLVK